MIPRKKLVDPSVHMRDARLYVLVVEGAETEPAYFEALRLADFIPKHRVIIRIVPPEDNKTAPNHLVSNAEKALDTIANKMPDDECWLVFDIDRQSGSNRLQQIHATLNVAQNQKWHVALSNPCFEVWLLLHVVENLDGITDAGNTAEDKLRELLGSYNKSRTPAPCLNVDSINSAIMRAKALDNDPRSPIPHLPSTRVYRLVERLLGAQAA